jgi:hypothetical protein
MKLPTYTSYAGAEIKRNHTKKKAQILKPSKGAAGPASSHRNTTDGASKDTAA